MKKILKRRSGEGYIDVCVLVVCAMLVLALVVRVLPVYITKQQLDTYAVELVREAEIAGRVGTETTRRAAAAEHPDLGRRRLPTAPGLTPTFGGPPPDASSSMTRSP